MSDVPLGVFLSGGIDSSIIAALLQKFLLKKLKHFQLISNKMYDESIYAEKVAKYLNTDHETLIANPNDAIDLIQKMPYVYSEPFADSSQIPTTLLSILVKKHVTAFCQVMVGTNYFQGIVDIFLLIIHLII